jgi:hypothetical protein
MGRSVDLYRFDQLELYRGLQQAYPNCKMHYIACNDVMEQFFTREKYGNLFFYVANEYQDSDPMSSFCRMVERIFGIDYVYDIALDIVFQDKDVDYDELVERLSLDIRVEMEKDRMKL